MADEDVPRQAAWRLVIYGLPAWPLAAMLFPVNLYLPTFYAREVGLGLSVAGAVLLAARFTDVITDPLVGVLSDRTRGRFGRRKPWILAGLPVVILAAWMLFQPPEGAGWGYLLGWAGLGYLGWTMMSLPLAALGAELSMSYHERSRIAAYREAFVVLGTFTAAALPALLGDGFATGHSDAGATAEVSGIEAALDVIVGWVVVGLPVITALMLTVVPEPRYPVLPPTDWRGGLRLIAANKPFRVLIGAYLVNGVANGLPATLFLLFAGSVIARPDWIGPLLLIYFGCGIAAVPLWLRISRRFGKHRTWSAAMLWASAFFALVPFLGEGDVYPFLIITVLTGLALGADLVLPTAMQADVIDEDTVATGRRRAGVFFALWGMATKLALALAVGLAFPLLDLAGFDSNAGADNDAWSLFTLAVLYAWAPVAFKLGAVWLMWHYPLGEAEQTALRSTLTERGGAPETP